MCIRVLLFLTLFVLPYCAWAAEGTPPSVHNEYNNSNVYNTGGTGMPTPHSTFPPEGIYTYDDPETGDHVVSVRSGHREDVRPQTPIIVEPIVRPF